MRTKVIPDVEKFVGNHSVSLMVGAVIVVGGYIYIKHNQSIASNANASPIASTMVPAYNVPAMTGVIGASGGLVDTASNPNISPTPSSSAPSSGNDGSGASAFDWATLALETSKQNNDFKLAEDTLNANLAIAEQNAAIAMQGIQASNWQTSAQLAEAFLQSGSVFFAGNIGGQTFQFLSAPKPYSGKNAIQVNAQQIALFNQMLGETNVLQPSIGSGTNVASTGTPTSPSMLASGSTQVASTNSGSSSGSSISSASNDNSGSGLPSQKSINGPIGGSLA